MDASTTSGPSPAAAVGLNHRAERGMAVLLLIVTVVSGLLDAVSYLQFGHVFVANLTGNVLFVAFSFAGVGSLSVVKSGIAILSFFVGALASGRLARSRPFSKPDLLMTMTGIELSLVLIVTALGLMDPSWSGGATYPAVALLAVAMGVQSATASRLQIPGFNSTVVLTTMLGTMAATTRLAGGSGAHNQRRLLAVLSMFGGALVGATLTMRVAYLAPLALAAVLLAGVCVGARLSAVSYGLSRKT